MPVMMSRPVSIDKMDTTEGQHHADEQINVWSKVWRSSIDSAEHINTLEWRKKEIDPTRALIGYTNIEISDKEVKHFRDVIRTFKKTTSTAHDRIPPRIIDELEDDTLRMLIRFLSDPR